MFLSIKESNFNAEMGKNVHIFMVTAEKWCHMVCAVWVSSNFAINLCAAPIFQSICLNVYLERIVDIQESHVTTSCQAV